MSSIRCWSNATSRSTSAESPARWVRGQHVDVDVQPVTVRLDGQGPWIPGEPDATALRGTLRADGTVITASVPHHSGVNR